MKLTTTLGLLPYCNIAFRLFSTIFIPTNSRLTIRLLGLGPVPAFLAGGWALDGLCAPGSAGGSDPCAMQQRTPCGFVVMDLPLPLAVYPQFRTSPVPPAAGRRRVAREIAHA